VEDGIRLGQPAVAGLVAERAFIAQRLAPWNTTAVDLLAFSCKSRWFCPSCHQKNVQTTAAFLTAHVLKLLVHLKLLPPERLQALHSWKHSGFNVHSGDPVPPENKAELEKLAQYILRNSFSVEKMTMESPTDTIIYRSRLNAKINRNFEVFTPTGFLAVITQHIPDKGAQMVRYYGWYSNKMRGQRQRAQNGGAASPPLRPPGTPPPPAKLPSKTWRDLILQVWHSDPLICPQCRNPMRVIAVIDQRTVIEKILRHLGQWSGTPPLAPARAPPDGDAGPWTREPFDDVDPMPDYENVLTD
jgi:hypothetical protein